MGYYLEGHSTSPRVMIPATVPSTKLHAQVPTASGLTAFAYYSCYTSIVGLGLTLTNPEATDEREFERRAEEIDSET